MRLIDADALKNVLNSGGGESVDINISKTMPLGEIVDIVIQAYRKCLFAELKKMPTAYDVDKVVERLGEMKNTSVDNIILNSQSDDLESEVECVEKHYDNIIDIVKEGGV